MLAAKIYLTMDGEESLLQWYLSSPSVVSYILTSYQEALWSFTLNVEAV
jgi:hypothetical protein